jgi:hypothetical protein
MSHVRVRFPAGMKRRMFRQARGRPGMSRGDGTSFSTPFLRNTIRRLDVMYPGDGYPGVAEIVRGGGRKPVRHVTTRVPVSYSARRPGGEGIETGRFSVSFSTGVGYTEI